MPPIVVNNHLCLRPLGMDDAAALFSLVDDNRLYLRQWLPWLDLTRTIADTQGFIRGAMENQTQGSGCVYAIVLDGLIQGLVGFNAINRAHNSAEVGYWLSQHATGQGLMTQAVAAMIHYGFTHLDLNRIKISAAVANAKSRAIPARLGFTQEATLRQEELLYGDYVDHVVYGLLRKEYWDIKP